MGMEGEWISQELGEGMNIVKTYCIIFLDNKVSEDQWIEDKAMLNVSNNLDSSLLIVTSENGKCCSNIKVMVPVTCATQHAVSMSIYTENNFVIKFLRYVSSYSRLYLHTTNFLKNIFVLTLNHLIQHLVNFLLANVPRYQWQFIVYDDGKNFIYSPN